MSESAWDSLGEVAGADFEAGEDSDSVDVGDLV